MDNKSSQGLVGDQYNCKLCDYYTCKISNYNKHLLTAKHLKATNDNIKVAESSQNIFKCVCGNTYNNRHNLCRHKKKCTLGEFPSARIASFACSGKPRSSTDITYMAISTDDEKKEVGDESCIRNNNETSIMELSRESVINNFNPILILDIIKENQEIKNLLLEQNKQFIELHKENNILNKENNILINKMVEISQTPTTVNNINTTNNNNQKFNLNFFLNETCKDAMNIQDFIENIKITFQDLLTIGDAGFVTGISDIFIKQLRDLEISKRPIHCTDSKRDTIYLKERNIWNKDDKDNTKLKDIIEKVEYKNVAALHQWCNENPDSKINNTTNNLLRDKIYIETLQGDERTRDKIIKNISREVIVEKET
jgi:hypothetical protein